MINIHHFNQEQKALRRRLLEVCDREKLGHLGSCLSAIDIISAVYRLKKPPDKFVLSNGHAALAQYVVLEQKGLFDLGSLKDVHIHPDRDPARGIHVSTGSLGQGLSIAVGMALADRKRDVYCMISDGECAEGSIWEALRVAEEAKLHNLIVMVNINGWGAYMPVDAERLQARFKGFGYHVCTVDGHSPEALDAVLGIKSAGARIIAAKTDSEQFPFLRGLDAHYHLMTPEEYGQAKEMLA